MMTTVLRKRTDAERAQRRVHENELAGRLVAAAGQLIAAQGEDDATHARMKLTVAISSLRRHWGIQP